ncbi:hypothetical protein F5890DRAFT_1238675 [Lentinula detonsa]|uniref:Uncharacterized protein n=1 Tax=Lentinula detonsa TaxID=2804962 RepID=A0AA38PNP1_9AGAR|nr:hypothetical protein F5890DRAFT_1238675 [Lentinula detonsa]
MERCLSRGLLIFDTPATKKLQKYIVYGTDRLKLQIQLNHIDALLHPIACGLTTLEGQNTTCSDVFYVFIGIAIGFNRVFKDPTSDIYQYRTETFGVFDCRFGIFLNDCTKDMFIISYLLDPMYYPDGALRLELPPRSVFSPKTCSKLLHRLISSVIEMLKNEQLHEKMGNIDDAHTLVKELTAYIYREAPYNVPVSDPAQRLVWWQSKLGDSNAAQLPKLGIKFFSCSPSEMCDERSASRLAAYNTAKRNGLSGKNLIWMAQLQQFWRYGFSDPKYTHTAKLDLKQMDNGGATIQLPTPKIQDLLNPVHSDSAENPSFNICVEFKAGTISEMTGKGRWDGGFFAGSKVLSGRQGRKGGKRSLLFMLPGCI